jgi:subtilisin family serine protease
LIKDQYIVVFRDGYSDIDARAQKLVGKTNGKLKHTFKAGLKGFSAVMTKEEAAAVSVDPSVAYVEQDQIVSAEGAKDTTRAKGGSKGRKVRDGTVSSTPGTTTQANARWNLDRIDQSDLPLNDTYTYSATGVGVNAYIVDTGIRTTHVEFGGRATLDFTAIDDGYGATGCHWHGTHVAGTIGGVTVGVAKNVLLHSVRVLDCNASGSWSAIIAGIDWVTANRILPAVMNVSISGGFSQAVNDAIDRATAAGITVVTAAGNYSADACGYSPASAVTSITVAGSGDSDARVISSDFGACIDIIAPGDNIVSAWNTSDTWLDVATGTSMAAPHVAGAAALYLERNPSATPASVATALFTVASVGKIKGFSSDTPNLLLRIK